MLNEKQKEEIRLREELNNILNDIVGKYNDDFKDEILNKVEEILNLNSGNKEYMLLGYYKNNDERPNLEVIFFSKNKEEVIKAKNDINLIQNLIRERKENESFNRDAEIEQEINFLSKELSEIDLNEIENLTLTRIKESEDI